MPLVLDIETIGLEASLTVSYPRDDFSAPANYKNAEAINDWHDRNAKDWSAKREKECSLNPRLGRIVCFGYAGPNGDPATLYAMTEADEAALLTDAWTLIAAHAGRVVTWNGAFDLRWLVVRSLAHGIVPLIDAATIREWFKKYAVFSHFDVKAALMNWDMKAAGEGLDEWAMFFGLPGKPEGIDGGMVAWMFREEQHDLIREYCASDVANTKAMYGRVSQYFGGNV